MAQIVLQEEEEQQQGQELLYHSMTFVELTLLAQLVVLRDPLVGSDTGCVGHDVGDVGLGEGGGGKTNLKKSL